MKAYNKIFVVFLAMLGLALIESVRGDIQITRNYMPEGSELRNQIKFTAPDDEIRESIVKLIPIGVSKADAEKLFKKLMPKVEEKVARMKIPPEMKKLKYRCFRLMGRTTFRPPGSQSIEVVFFFDDGKLKEVRVRKPGFVL